MSSVPKMEKKEPLAGSRSEARAVNAEYERRAAMNIMFLDGHAKWKRLSEATSAQYGSGPNLHGLFSPKSPDDSLFGVDFVN